MAPDRFQCPGVRSCFSVMTSTVSYLFPSSASLTSTWIYVLFQVQKSVTEKYVDATSSWLVVWLTRTSPQVNNSFVSGLTLVVIQLPLPVLCRSLLRQILKCVSHVSVSQWGRLPPSQHFLVPFVLQVLSWFV